MCVDSVSDIKATINLQLRVYALGVVGFKT